MGTIGKPPSIPPLIETDSIKDVSKKVTGYWVLAATILGASMAYIDGTAVNVALPALQEQLDATIVDMQWVIEAYALFLASLILVGGALGDRYGRRLVYGIGITLFAASSILCGLSENVDQLIYFRAVQGIGGAMMIPGSLAIITVFFDESERGKAIGTWSAFSAITTAIGPVLGGWLIEEVSWRWIFFINIPIAIVVLVILFFRVPESKGELSKCKIDYLGGVLATIGLGGIVYGFIESAALGFADPLVFGSLAVGVASLVAFIIVENRVEAPMMPLKLFRSTTFSGANLVTFLMYAPFGGTLFFLPFVMIQIYDYTAIEAGASFLPIIILLFLFSRWSGGLVDKYGAKLPLVFGNIIQAVGYVLFALLGGGGSYFLTFFPGMFVLGLGLALSVAPLTTAVMNAVPNSFSGTASGINNAVSRVSGLVAIAILGIVMLILFSSGMDAGMHLHSIPQEVQEAFKGEYINLANAETPIGIASDLEEKLKNLVDLSYVSSFNILMYIAAGLSLLSALVAWIMIRDKKGIG
ncbi:MAG: MFS transporter [Deltaproteobacteria bacterium]|nr:MFS transporter [Deltaproteobacteria bacterium]